MPEAGSSFAFVPRQVMLQSAGGAAAQAEGKGRRTSEVEKREKKKSKRSRIQERPSEGLAIDDLEPADGAVAPRKGRGREILLTAIAAFLESNELSRTLAAFQSEAKFEVDSWKSSPVNLDDLFCRFLDVSNVPMGANINRQKPQDKVDRPGEITRKYRNDVSEEGHKKKRERSGGAVNGTGLTAGDPPIDIISFENVHSVDKSEGGVSQEVTKELRSPGDETEFEKFKSVQDTEDGSKKKKKKKNLSAKDADVDQQSPRGENASLEPLSKFHEKSKKKKSEKLKLDGNSSNEVAAPVGCDKFDGIMKYRTEESKLLVSELSMSAVKIKGDKKKKNVTQNSEETDKDLTEKKIIVRKSSSENICAMIVDKTDACTPVDQDRIKTNAGKEKFFEENVDNTDRKVSKKRKKSAAEENASKSNNKAAGMDSDVKYQGAENNKGTGPVFEDGKVELDVGKIVSAKKRKMEQTNAITEAPVEDNITAHGLSTKVAKHRLENGHRGSDKSGRNTLSQESAEEKSLSEQKTTNAFQRVKVGAVEFADDRLQDNSYWAKDGADSGYGAKAQEVLGQVRGRNFRHEKTKKKRGTYRGGQIDLQSHSVKFNNSDEE